MSKSNNRTQARTFHKNGQTLVTIKTLLAFLLFVVISSEAVAASIEDYGRLPANRSMTISPNGEMLAWIREENDGKVYLVVVDTETLKPVRIVAIEEKAKTRNAFFANNTYIILQASNARKLAFVRQKFEDSAAYSVNIKTGKIALLLRNTPNLHFAQTGFGNVIGIDEKNNKALMPAFDDSSNRLYNLYSVDLDTGRGKRLAKGKPRTIRWHVDSNGKPFAREDYAEKSDTYSVFSYNNGRKPHKIYEDKTDIPNLDIIGTNKENNSLIIFSEENSDEYLSELSLTTGEFKNNLLSTENSNFIDYTKDANGNIFGVKISGLIPSYHFFDEKLNTTFQNLSNKFSGRSIHVLSQTRDFSQVIISVSGTGYPDSMFLFNTNTKKLRHLGNQYNKIEKNQTADIIGFKYHARDNKELTAIATWPTGVPEDSRKNLPTLIFPHGGPESHDFVRFNWFAQYFASRGYLVIQPNFRGSSGFGGEFARAGYGEWGKKMQDDITDTLDHLIGLGITDKDRSCIVGASYGGYAALAAGAFTPKKFRCVVSINGVSDLQDLIKYTEFYFGKNSFQVNYWYESIINDSLSNDQLKEISPIHHSGKFQVPTLLIYSVDDTIVPPRQTLNLYKKLKKQGKSAQQVKLKGEDHWLSNSETRLSTLKAIDEFLNEHNPI